MSERKNMYSLMLSEDIVAMIDQLAYRKKSNRSNMINQILAEYLSYQTPEMRLREIFEQLETTLCRGEDVVFQRLAASSDSVFQLRSALAFKYNPTVRYTVELNKNHAQTLGELRVSLRTQNENLLFYLRRFYQLWMTLEERVTGRAVPYQIGGDKLIRQLVLVCTPGGSGETTAVLGDVIARYVDAFDRALKCYFANLDDLEEAQRQVQVILSLYQRENTLRV